MFLQTIPNDFSRKNFQTHQTLLLNHQTKPRTFHRFPHVFFSQPPPNPSGDHNHQHCGALVLWPRAAWQRQLPARYEGLPGAAESVSGGSHEGSATTRQAWDDWMEIVGISQSDMVDMLDMVDMVDDWDI